MSVSELVSLDLLTEEGESYPFASLVGDSPVFIFFVRHFG